MSKTRVASVGRAPKSYVEIKRDLAIKKHSEHPERIEEIERKTLKFQKRELSGEEFDRSAALQQFEREIDSIGAHIPLPPKDPGPKSSPIAKTVPRHRVPGRKATSLTKKRKKPNAKRKTQKRIRGK
jgi:hypothetical protein